MLEVSSVARPSLVPFCLQIGLLKAFCRLKALVRRGITKIAEEEEPNDSGEGVKPTHSYQTRTKNLLLFLNTDVTPSAKPSLPTVFPRLVSMEASLDIERNPLRAP